MVSVQVESVTFFVSVDSADEAKAAAITVTVDAERFVIWPALPRRRVTTPREVEKVIRRALERNPWLGYSRHPMTDGEPGCVLHEPTHRMYEGFDEPLIACQDAFAEVCRGVGEGRWDAIALVISAPGVREPHLRPLKVGLFESTCGRHAALPDDLRYVHFVVTPYDANMFQPGYEVDPTWQAVPATTGKR